MGQLCKTGVDKMGLLRKFVDQMGVDQIGVDQAKYKPLYRN